MSISNDTMKQMKFQSEKKSDTLAYVLLFFLGFFGGHRFYLGKIGTGILQLILTFLSGGLITLIWIVVDLFLIPGMVRKYNNQLIQTLDE